MLHTVLGRFSKFEILSISVKFFLIYNNFYYRVFVLFHENVIYFENKNGKIRNINVCEYGCSNGAKLSHYYYMCSVLSYLYSDIFFVFSLILFSFSQHICIQSYRVCIQSTYMYSVSSCMYSVWSYLCTVNLYVFSLILYVFNLILYIFSHFLNICSATCYMHSDDIFFVKTFNVLCVMLKIFLKFVFLKKRKQWMHVMQ